MYKYIFKGSNFFILLFFVFIVTSGQEFPDVPGKYKNEMAVVLSKEKHITISYSQNNKLEIKSENRLEKLYLSDKANYYGDEYIYNTFFFQTENLEAYLFTPRKYLGYKKTEIENITTQN